jgi:light-regulated signal transduction histidine kinase (bacteriophytochrome)
MFDLKEKYKIPIMAILLAACVILNCFFHDIVEIDIVFTHFFYIPIILATLWWERKGLVVPVFLAIILNIGCIHTGHDVDHFNNLIRSLMFIVIGSIVAELRFKILKREEELRRSHEYLKQRATELAAVNKELEAFNYSVSHDLRSPLRSIDGFSQVLLEDYADELDAQGKDYLLRVRAATQNMAQLIDDLLNLSSITRSKIHRRIVNLSVLAQDVTAGLKKMEPERQVEFVISADLMVKGDERLLKIVLENLLGNAWKFTGNNPKAKIELGVTQVDGRSAYFVRDNGAGFDMAYASKLFGAFQRLHSPSEFSGNGIGLATVQRIIHRHGGQVWAEGAVGQGATFYFTL